MALKPSKYLLTLALASIFSLSGCLGPNHAGGHLAQWNNSFENKWAKEGIFLLVLPGYALFGMGDVLIFNSWQWWSGQNPISRPGEETGHGF